MTEQARYYLDLFGSDPAYSMHCPNVEESTRWAKIAGYLSAIAERSGDPGARPRILDVGCGRGWMTEAAGLYGPCDGLDPVEAVIALARTRYPGRSFHAGTLDDLLGMPDFRPYDVVMCSEVIEHLHDKAQFASLLRRCLVPGGHLLLTTPRQELFERYRRAGHGLQPVEEWLTEAQLRETFARAGFTAVERDRVYLPLPELSLLHRACESRRLSAILEGARLLWLQEGLKHLAAIYQAWWFRVSAQ